MKGNKVVDLYDLGNSLDDPAKAKDKASTIMARNCF